MIVNLMIFLVLCVNNCLLVKLNEAKVTPTNNDKYLLNEFSENKDVYLTSLVEQAVTFTCTINLDQKNYSKSGDYKILWSKETPNGDDYELLVIDDTPLLKDSRLFANRIIRNKVNYQEIEWNLFIYNLKLNDSNYYICQLNVPPYDSYWLKRFRLEVNAPPTFIDEETDSDQQLIQNNDHYDHVSSETSLYVKTVKEFEDFKLKCMATGKPTPSVSWHIKYLNGSTALLATNSSEILIRNIKRSSKIDRIECQASNGIGASASRLFKINLLFSPHILTKHRTYRVPTRTTDFRLNCTVVSNPQSKIYWLFLPRGTELETIKDNGTTNMTYDNIIKINTNWTLIESYHTQTSNVKHLSSNSDQILYRLPITKHQIYEQKLHSQLITSILYITIIDESDFGTYRCLAVNSINNQTFDFRVDELKQELFNHNRLYKSNTNNETNKFNHNKYHKTQNNDQNKYKYEDNNQNSDQNFNNENLNTDDDSFIYRSSSSTANRVYCCYYYYCFSYFNSILISFFLIIFLY